nr:hypothetical protein Iba_chr05eCG15080 [Ipomoea batatas]GME00954.1 hypothetical protein Iba_scaffold484570CG0010 [Ipomoea batatas]GME21652.1 hypothetical protein Iba_scaffold28767CG0030 [Ipomoea batatas]
MACQTHQVMTGLEYFPLEISVHQPALLKIEWQVHLCCVQHLLSINLQITPTPSTKKREKDH